jgi:glutathione S-transferase
LITLYSFGPAFDLPDPSPFVMKAELLLRMASLPFRTDTSGFSKAPKGKLPYIDDEGERIADSTFIRWHLERKYNIDFDRGLTSEQRARAWAFEKMVEDSLYWAIVYIRWMDDGNFAKGPSLFFRRVPLPVRPLVTRAVRRKIRRHLHGHGMGRHSPSEIIALATRSLEAIAEELGNKPYFMGDEPTGADAAIFAFTVGALCPIFDSQLKTVAGKHENVRRYVGRMTARYYPERAEMVGCRAC